MASIPIHNETAYALTDDMTQQIIRDAQEHFGEEVRAIRVQSGIARHALNARTREVRYAFFPQDFGLGHPMSTVHEPFDHSAALSDRDAATADVILPVPFEDVEEDEEDGEDIETLETSLENLVEGQDDEEEDDVFTLDAPVEDTDEDDEENLLDDEEDNVFERAGRCWGLWSNSGTIAWLIHLPLEPGEAPVCVSNFNSSCAAVRGMKRLSPM